MIRFYIPVLLMTLLVGCATYQPKYAEPFNAKPVEIDAEVSHTFYLIGDAGKSPMGDLNPALKAFKARLTKADENSTAIFLGDNIYPAGLPDKKDSTKAYLAAKNHLDAQLKTLGDFKGKPVFIPGNHDWYNNGLVGLKRQEKYIEDALDSKEVFFPEDGCPIETIEISDDIIVVALDTEWYMVNWDRHPTINDDCEIKDRHKFFEELEGIIKKNASKTILLAMHHPMFTYGPHGGQFSAKQHLYPSSAKIPLPGLASLANLLRKTSGATFEDQSNKMYNELKQRLVTLAQYADKVIFASGHEHTLQYIVEENIPQIVSGAGAKKGVTRLLNGSQFSSGQMGYAVLTVYKDGGSKVDFFSVEDKERLTYSTAVFPPDKDAVEFPDKQDFPSFVSASIYTDDEVAKTGFFKKVWGQRYRKYYATKVKAPTVDLDTLFGGLQPLRKGGGHQSKSLRLVHQDGRQFVMRALKKSAELYLQALVFKNEYIIGELEGTLPETILKDFYTGAHPYAPFVTGTLSDAVGVFHTNPKLYYIPKQSALGTFNDVFGDELYMIEEHVSDGHDIAGFGYTKKIESTDDLMKKLRKDEEYQVDAEAYVKARLFDMLIGDWDRHVDQWRWAQFKENGKKVFRPIPRDRDQTFSIMGDGALMGLTTRTIAGLKLFEGFNDEIRNVRGFNSSPMTYALDLALLSQTKKAQWIAQAQYIQDNLTETAIDKALLEFPKEVRDQTVTDIKRKLLARKANLVQTAKTYYDIINTYGIITGTDKDDHFVISGDDKGNVQVKAYRIKEGKKKDLFFDKTFDAGVTKEIWVYGLDDDDVFEATPLKGGIKVRLIGGQNNDVYKIDKKAASVHVYDFKTKKNTYDEAFGGRIHKTNDYDTNTYQFLKVKASTNQLLPSIGVNPDDGLRIGFSNTYTFNGFRQNPFTQQHTVNAAYYFATNGFDLGYKGEFAHVFEGVNLELSAKLTSPNFAINFFGFGNDTANTDDQNPLALDFNRVRIETIAFAPSLVWRGHLGSEVRLGASYENYYVEETADRFIEGFFTRQARDTQQDFFGVHASYQYSNTDNAAYPTMGMAFGLEAGYRTNLRETDRSFAFLVPSLSIDHRLTANGRLVLATKLKGHMNFGDGFEFYQAASLGANNGLRGFRFQRFTGKSAFFQNTDLRWSFRKQKTGILPVTPGIFTGFDYGRVWLPNEDSNTWHNSYGGGFFVSGADLISANIGLFQSADGLRFNFGIGFGF